MSIVVVQCVVNVNMCFSRTLVWVVIGSVFLNIGFFPFENKMNLYLEGILGPGKRICT